MTCRYFLFGTAVKTVSDDRDIHGQAFEYDARKGRVSKILGFGVLKGSNGKKITLTSQEIEAYKLEKGSVIQIIESNNTIELTPISESSAIMAAFRTAYRDKFGQSFGA